MTHEPEDFERIPPQDLDAEQAVLGAMLLSPKNVIDQVLPVVKPGDFYRPAHELIFTVICDVFGRSRDPRIDPITIAAELTKRGEIAQVGGASYLHTLVQQTPTAANAEYYAEIVFEKAQLRRVIEASARAASRAYASQGEASEIVDDAMAEFQGAATGISAIEAKLSVSDRWAGFLDELEAGRDPRALDTPWPDLNDVVELKPGQLVTVGAATGGGKSLFGANLAAHVAMARNRPVLAASMEMGGSELMARLTAAEASVNLDRLIRRKLEDSDWEKIAKISERLQNAANFVLDDSPSLTIGKIRARMRWMASRGTPPAMVVVDYLQLLTPEGKGGGEKSRAAEVADLSRNLKLLAMEFEIPVVALAQFNRNAVGRQPLVSDFKDSSAIEQDSNVIVLMHRPLAEDGSDTGERAGEIDLIVAKNRNGVSGRIVPLAFQGHYARLRSLGRAA
ncbi:replicative DNA helicase [Streptomyces kronopolitis]|uniref:replicative DNA helicase n=1 Tax=Streptomyces kronopolitis TaxID=1612435 RepID=UPI0034240A05